MKPEVHIIGATGIVGQLLVHAVATAPDLQLGKLCGSDGRAGTRYGEAVVWRIPQELPAHVQEKTLHKMADIEGGIVLSALPSGIALTVETDLAQRGCTVISNAAAHRMDPLVPLLVPEINAGALDGLDRQKTAGKIITNPNCIVSILSLPLCPLLGVGTVTHINLVTLQALSGAGYPGVPSLDALGNVVPHIPEEAPKIQEELDKIFGNPLPTSIQVNRVPVLHGHMICLQIHYDAPVDLGDVTQKVQAWSAAHGNCLIFHTAPQRPQPLLDCHFDEMGVHVGPLALDPHRKVLSLTVLGHNLVRGAAGAALANLRAYLKTV